MSCFSAPATRRGASSPKRLIDHWGKGRFKGYSAGSFPKGAVHPLAVEILDNLHLRTSGLRSKSWNESARPGAR